MENNNKGKRKLSEAMDMFMAIERQHGFMDIYLFPNTSVAYIK